MTENISKKYDIHLEGVPQTLLMPLLGRARFSQESFSPIQDTLAIQLVESLNYNFDELGKHLRNVTPFWMARAYHFDEAIKNYLNKHPNGKIVNLGAGLETAFFRIDNQKLTWFDLDLPEVISLREKLLPKSDRVYQIAKSIFDYTWINDIKNHGDEFFFFAGGVFMYFTEAQIKSLFLEMARQFPGSELMFDILSKKGIYYANKMLKKSNMPNAIMQWGIDDSELLEEWSSHIKIVNHISYFKDIKMMKGIPLGLRLKMFLYDVSNQHGIVHLKFF